MEEISNELKDDLLQSDQKLLFHAKRCKGAGTRRYVRCKYEMKASSEVQSVCTNNPRLRMRRVKTKRTAWTLWKELLVIWCTFKAFEHYVIKFFGLLDFPKLYHLETHQVEGVEVATHYYAF